MLERLSIALRIALAATLATSSAALPAQEPAAESAPAEPSEPFTDIAKDAPAARLELRHEQLSARLQAFLGAKEPAAPEQQRQAAQRLLAAISLEWAAFRRAGSLDELRTLAPNALGERVLGAELTAGEATAAARWLFTAGARAAGEDAVAKARALDPAQRKAGDRLLATARGEAVPKGGYHRYRGEFMALAKRDRARRLDDALVALASLGEVEFTLPVDPPAERTRLPEFLAERAETFAAMRGAATWLRDRLRVDYGAVRGWLASYSSSAALRRELLAAHAAMADPRKELLELIGRYDKPEQPDVDARRAALEEAYGRYEELVARDRRALGRVPERAAYELLERVRAREVALTRVDVLLRGEGEAGLGAFPRERGRDAATGAERLLPGREQSGLEDTLWLLVHFRAGQLRDVVRRAADLQRQRDKLTDWEAWLLEELLADAVELYNDRSAFSLDATEWQFVGVLNRYRRVLGLRPYEVEERLNAASQKHSQEMIDLGYFGHVSPVARNRGPTDRARLEGFGGGVGENCLGGRVDGRGAFEGWYHSPGHHRGMVSRSPQLGVGAAGDHSMWTMVMGGTDAGWSNLHRDLAPAQREQCEKAAEEFAWASGPAEPKPKELERLRRAQVDIDARLPDVLPAVARIAFVAAADQRSPHHDASAALLRQLIVAELPIEWRPLQVAAVAASIDLLRFGQTADLRRRAFETVTPLLGKSFEFRPEAAGGERREPVLAIRAHWEDEAQWQFRRSGPAPVANPVPGRAASGDGPSERARLKVLTRSERLRLAKKNGGGSDTEKAIERALDWLASVQDDDGAFRARAFMLHLEDAEPRSAGLGQGEWDLAMTGLSVLAFVTAGHTMDQGEHAPVVDSAVRWLASRAVDYGRFETVSGHYMYSHAIATQALCEAYAYTDDPYIGEVAQLALDFLVFAQDRSGGGWRYEPRQAGDTSVVGWVVMALNAGHKAGLDVVGFRDALRFIEAMTEPGYYQVGYVARPGLGGENLRLTSVGMVSRLFLGEAPEVPEVALPSHRLVEQPPTARTADLYYWYYATLALFQVGGDRWKEWNKALRPTMLGLQDTGRRSPYYGSWRTTGGFDGRGGRVYSTAMAVLILTTYYRYDRAPKLKLHPFTGNLRELTAPFLARLRASKDPQERALILARLADEIGPSLVPVVCQVLRDESEPKDLRRQLAGLLVTISMPQHEALLLPLLALKDGPSAAQAARALVGIASERSAPALQGALEHPDRNVRIFAARALGRLGVQKATAALADRRGRERDGAAQRALDQALQALAHRDELAVLVDAALPADKPGRLAVFDTLQLLQSSGITPLILGTRQAEPALWQRIVAAVGEHEDRALVPVLMILLESESPENRAATIKMLGAVTRQTHGFDPQADKRSRKRSLERWKRWWKERGGGY